MERLTKRDTDGQAIMDCEKCKADWTGKHGKPMVDCTALYCRNRLKNRLAAYEDTGLTPEDCARATEIDDILLDEYYPSGRMRELINAYELGRLDGTKQCMDNVSCVPLDKCGFHVREETADEHDTKSLEYLQQCLVELVEAKNNGYVKMADIEKALRGEYKLVNSAE